LGATLKFHNFSCNLVFIDKIGNQKRWLRQICNEIKTAKTILKCHNFRDRKLKFGIYIRERGEYRTVDNTRHCNISVFVYRFVGHWPLDSTLRGRYSNNLSKLIVFSHFPLLCAQLSGSTDCPEFTPFLYVECNKTLNCLFLLKCEITNARVRDVECNETLNCLFGKI